MSSKRKLNEDEKMVKYITKPKLCGFFSIDKNCKYRSDVSQMRYIYPPYLQKEGCSGVQFDLNTDYDLIFPKTQNRKSLPNANLYKWVMENPHQTKGVDFVSFRGTYSTLIIPSLVEQVEDWRISACRIGNTIYLCAFDTEIKKRNREAQMKKGHQVRSTNWGFKFEQFMLTDNPKIKPTGEGELHLNEEFCMLYHSELKNYKLLYGAEMDGIVSDSIIDDVSIEKLKNKECVELKLGRCEGIKLLKWWAQSYFVGIEKIISASRKKPRFVTGLQNIQVKNLAYSVLTPERCLSFLYQILDFIYDTLFKAEPLTYWLFEWNPEKRHEIKTSSTDLDEYKFLGEEFITFMTNFTSSSDSLNSLNKSFKRKIYDESEKNTKKKKAKKPVDNSSQTSATTFSNDDQVDEANINDRCNRSENFGNSNERFRFESNNIYPRFDKRSRNNRFNRGKRNDKFGRGNSRFDEGRFNKSHKFDWI